MTQMPPRIATPDTPPLFDGMRMDRDTFHRLYCLHPEIRKAELIEGVVYVASPVSAIHGDPHDDCYYWMRTYCVATPSTRASNNVSLMLSAGTECQPNISLYVRPTHGGRVTYTPELYLSGSPELVAEISVSTEALDTGARMEAYRTGGVQEYIVWRVLSQAIDWYVLRDGQYELLLADAEGVVRSEVFPGLWLDVPAMLRGDMTGVLAALRAGIALRQGGST